MNIIPLPKAATAEHGWTHKAIVDYTDIAALGASATGVLAIFPSSGNFNAKTIFGNFGYRLKTAFDFSDAAVNSLTIQIGITGGDVDKYLVAAEISADGSTVSSYIEDAATTPQAENTADTVDALFTCSGGASPTLAECTSGEIHIFFTVVDTADFEDIEA